MQRPSKLEPGFCGAKVWSSRTRKTGHGRNLGFYVIGLRNVSPYTLFSTGLSSEVYRF